MMGLPHLLLAYYGDDFTGSTDVMEALTLNGLPTVLFLQPPTEEQRRAFAHCRAIGFAGISRSKDPAWMDAHLPAIFAGMKALNAPVSQYKVCSTFDSSPTVGSIGRALDIGRAVFGGQGCTPVLAGAPALGRYTVFGNHFATAAGQPHRLDRHPTMARHPVTPMAEADLRRHLAAQTAATVALFDILALQAGDADARFDALLAGRPDAVLFDALDRASLAQAGRLIWERLAAPRFCVASSGLEYALVEHWRAAGLLPDAPSPPPPVPVDRIMAVSGSCSPATAEQIGWALGHGFAGIRLDPARVVAAESRDQEIHAAVRASAAALAAGASPLVYTARGPDDPAVSAFDAFLARTALSRERANEGIGRALGRILREVVLTTGLRRAVVAGGDTSGHVNGELGAYALTVAAPLAPGAPLCAMHAADPRLRGLEIALKGGQMGQADFFGAVRRGG